MKIVIASLAAALLGAGPSLSAAENPRGDLLELHSCQLYIGGCIASAEATQEGHYLLRVWNFDGGSHGGVALTGLQVAVLQVSDQNLAAPKTVATESVVYVPATATAAETTALIDWIKATNPELRRTRLHTRAVPMSLARADGQVTFVAGDSLRVIATPLAPCGLSSCGESLWYQPRSPVTQYTVALTDTVNIREPMVSLKWIDHGKNSVFEGRFRDGQTTAAVFEPLTQMCAAPEHAHHE